MSWRSHERQSPTDVRSRWKKNGKEKMVKIVGEDEKTVREGRGEEESDREM